ncbi:hypothetical protein XHV734_1099 [Xanthomonas hortorum pv. vitians]|nr:hypothetical protein XHV734_1099 [Xanthomonas hortorum pv. vitians]
MMARVAVFLGDGALTSFNRLNKARDPRDFLPGHGQRSDAARAARPRPTELLPASIRRDDSIIRLS